MRRVYQHIYHRPHRRVLFFLHSNHQAAAAGSTLVVVDTDPGHMGLVLAAHKDLVGRRLVGRDLVGRALGFRIGLEGGYHSSLAELVDLLDPRRSVLAEDSLEVGHLELSVCICQ